MITVVCLRIAMLMGSDFSSDSQVQILAKFSLALGEVPHAFHVPIDSSGSGRGFSWIRIGAAGCSSRRWLIARVTITVSLPISTVVVPKDGTQGIVPIEITSISGTARVAVSSLPSGLQEKYAASDTNPSGSLAFTARTATAAGIHTPTATVKSAGQTASTNFTLVVTE
jgi:hypothetical protein